MALTPRVTAALLIYRTGSTATWTDHLTLIGLLMGMTIKETEMYYRGVRENRDALRRAEEEIEWPVALPHVPIASKS
jgi:hypothetical protein